MGAVKTLHRGRKDVAGAAAVEFAIVLPLLLLLVLGGLDWGYYFFIAQVTTNAAREGARAGSLQLQSGPSTVAAQDAVNDYLQRAGLGLDRLLVLAVDPDFVVSVNGESITSVKVDVSYRTGSLTGFMQVIVPNAANATAVMRRL